MAQLAERVRALTELITNGQTLEAMERFYADEVTMQENEGEPRVGKAVCLEHEKQMLASVSAMQATLVRQAIDEAGGIVFSEWQYGFVNSAGQLYQLTEVSVQQWRNERIQSEKFYYNKILMVS